MQHLVQDFFIQFNSVDLSVFQILSAILIGLGVATLSSFLGFGGGTLMVPLLTLTINAPPAEILATSLFVIILNAGNNTYNFNKKNLVDWEIALKVASTAVIFSILSARFTTLIDAGLSRWLTIGTFSLVALISYKGDRLIPKVFHNPTTKNLLIAGMLAGTSSGLAGIGGSTLLMPLLLVLGWTENQKAAPTGNAINFLAASSSLFTFFFSGQKIHFLVGILIFTTSAFFAHFFRKMQGRLTVSQRKNGILVFLLIVIAFLVQRAIE